MGSKGSDLAAFCSSMAPLAPFCTACATSTATAYHTEPVIDYNMTAMP